MPDLQTLQDHNDDLMAEVAMLRKELRDTIHQRHMMFNVALKLAQRLLEHEPELQPSPGWLVQQIREEIAAQDLNLSGIVYKPGMRIGD